MGDFNANPNSKVIKKFAAGEYNTDRFVAVQEVKKELSPQVLNLIRELFSMNHWDSMITTVCR